MPHFHRLSCKLCGGHRDDVGPISATGKCAECGDAIYIANHRELMAHDGPHFEHWRRRCLAAFGITLDEGQAA